MILRITENIPWIEGCTGDIVTLALFNGFIPHVNNCQDIYSNCIPCSVGIPTGCPWTRNMNTADSLLKQGTVSADKSTTKIISALKAEHDKVITSSTALSASDSYLAPEGLDYYPHQVAGIKAGLERPGLLIADDTGLGKLVLAIGIINNDQSMNRGYVLCPSEMKEYIVQIIEKWCIRPLIVQDCNSNTKAEANVRVMSYASAASYDGMALLRVESLDFIICYDAAQLSNPRSKKTRSVVGNWETRNHKRLAPVEALRKIFISPYKRYSSPIEMWPGLHYLDEENYQSYHYFSRKFCGATPGIKFNKWKWRSSNGKEFQEKLLSTVMIRRRLKDVYPNGL